VPGQETGQRRRLIEAHKAAHEFYAERISAPDAAPAREFLAQRGFTLEDARRFGIGYSPRAWEELARHLRARGFTDEELTKAGLARRGQRGLIDMFRGRLMWPIRDLTGETVAFGARKLDPNDDPKYLNTPETPLFKKSQVLYGADLAKRDIARRRQAVIVEGYTDVMACHLSGVPTAVATCGTSFGEDHVKVLRRLIMDTEGSHGEVIFTFDGDAAGQKAALRSFGLEEKFAVNTYVAVQPDGLDPCDLRIKHGDAAVRDLIAQRRWLFEFVIRSTLAKHDLENTAGQLAALDEAAPIVARIKDPSDRKRYAANLDRWLGFMDEQFVLQRVNQHARGPRSRRGAPARSGATAARNAGPGPDQPYDRSDPALQTQREALKLAVQVPALAGPTFDALAPESFTHPAHEGVAILIRNCGGVASAGRPAEWAARLTESAPDDQARAFLRELVVEPLLFADEPDDRYVDRILAQVGALALDRRIVALKGRLQRMNAVTEQEAHMRLFGEVIMLEQQKKALTDRVNGG
jgi:DNA primase